MTNFPPSYAADGPTAMPTVLLVDDDAVNLLITAQALRERGFAVTEAGSGSEALDLLIGWAPDLVVLDARMPDPDGFATCATLRARPGCEHLPVLMLTGLEDEASVAHAYEVGATDFFVKSAAQYSLLAGRLQYLLRASRTRQELERSKAKLAHAQDMARMGSFDWRQRDGALMLAPEGLRVLGRSPGERPTLRALLRGLSPEDRGGLMRMLSEMVHQHSVLATDLPLRLPDGRLRVVHVEAEPEFNDLGQSIGYTGILQDVTDRRVAEDRIRHLANFDTLTGLPNRRQLIWRAERALEYARRMNHQAGLLLIDLDRFKIINDLFGHTAGDELLMEVARRLKSCVRHSDQVMESSLESMGSR